MWTASRHAALLAALCSCAGPASAVPLAPGHAVVVEQNRNTGASRLLMVDLGDGSSQTLSTSAALNDAEGIVIESSTSVIVAVHGEHATSPAYTDSRILRVNTLDGSISEIASGGYLRSTNSLTVSPDGTLYTSQSRDGSIVAIDPLTGQQTLIVDDSIQLEPVDIGPPGPIAILSLDDDTLAFLDSGVASLRELSLTDVTASLVAAVLGHQLALAPDGTVLVGVYNMIAIPDGSGGADVVFTSGSTGNILGMAFDGAGQLHVIQNIATTGGGRITRVDLATGGEEVLYQATASRSLRAIAIVAEPAGLGWLVLVVASLASCGRASPQRSS